MPPGQKNHWRAWIDWVDDAASVVTEIRRQQGHLRHLQKQSRLFWGGPKELMSSEQYVFVKVETSLAMIYGVNQSFYFEDVGIDQMLISVRIICKY